MTETYIGHALSGEDPGDIDDWVEQWHKGQSRLELHEYLGMTLEEYSNWVLAPDALQHIIATRKLVAEAKINLEQIAAEATGNIN